MHQLISFPSAAVRFSIVILVIRRPKKIEISLSIQAQKLFGALVPIPDLQLIAMLPIDYNNKGTPKVTRKKQKTKRILFLST